MNNIKVKYIYVAIIWAYLFFFQFKNNIHAQSKSKYNILFIAIDDLRPQLHSFGDQEIYSPNIDKLAGEGMLFKRAYSQISSCNPSRSSLLTSRYPDITQIFDNAPHIRDNLPDVTTLPQQFKNNGYFTQSLGKIFHGAFKNEIRDDPPSWSTPPWRPKGIQYFTKAGLSIVQKRHSKYIKETGSIWKAMKMRRLKGLAWEAPDLPDKDFMDGKTANKAIKELQKLKNKKKPFFLGVGFVKPHLPFVAPKKYFDLYKDRKIQVYSNRNLPKGASEFANENNSQELRGYDFVPQKGQIPSMQAHQLTLAYDACVSFIDAQIGRILDKLDHFGLRRNTIVVLWGDHGYQLGQLGLWAKNTVFENALRAPLIISVPGDAYVRKRTKNIVEFVDIFPTLCELAGIPTPKKVQGNSLVPLLRGHPENYHANFAFSQAPWTWFGKNAKKYMGYSIRTAKYRYTEWIPQDTIRKKPEKELYMYQGSLEETANLASSKEYSNVVKRLSKMLHDKKEKILEEK